MFSNKYIEFEIEKFVTTINTKKYLNYRYEYFIPNYKFNKYRCLGRIWDSKTWDINKQCNNSAYNGLILCKVCWNKKNNCGLVNEYPDEYKVLKWYRNGIKKQTIYKSRDIDKEIDLNCYIKYKLPKKISHTKDNMKIRINYKIKKFKIKKNIESQLDLKDNIYLEWWNSELTDKIYLHDIESGYKHMFAMEKVNDKCYLLNKNQIVMGIYKCWEDTNNKIPDCFKNNNNQVLDPNSAVPLNEYILYKNNKLYNELEPGKYHEYRYDTCKEELIYTNLVEYI